NRRDATGRSANSRASPRVLGPRAVAGGSRAARRAWRELALAATDRLFGPAAPSARAGRAVGPAGGGLGALARALADPTPGRLRQPVVDHAPVGRDPPLRLAERQPPGADLLVQPVLDGVLGLGAE